MISPDNLLELKGSGAFDSLLVTNKLLDLNDLQQSIQVLTEHTRGIRSQTGADRVGTPYYLAPELWNNQPCTKPSDIWALGVILYEMCCHQYPFPATSEPELKNKVLTQKMDKVKHGVNPEFVQFINQMLKKDLGERPCIEQIIYNDLFQQKA